MKFFIDSEFISDGKTIDLVSIAIVCENGKDLYRECCDFDASKATSWVKENVLAHLSSIPGSSRDLIAYDVKTFIDKQVPIEDIANIEFWGDYCAFDFVVLSQLFGTFDTWPDHWPFFMHDLRQLMESSHIFPQPNESNHNALDDAREIKRQYDAIMR